MHPHLTDETARNAVTPGPTLGPPISQPTPERAPADAEPFSTELRAATRREHTDAERAPFAHALVRGEVPLAGFQALLLQLVQIYAELETVGEAVRDDPVAGGFVDDALLRRPALESDLHVLVGPHWRDQVDPLPATLAYTARLREVGSEPARFVAHHYTRYLGDLSGGQIIGRMAARTYQLDDRSGSFFRFDAIEDQAAFKDAYRARLDAAPWDAEERAAVIDESQLAFGLNARLFGDLGRIHGV
jgi:heme oxygenase